MSQTQTENLLMVLSKQMSTMHYVIVQTREQEFQHAGVSCAAKRRKRRRKLEHAMHGKQTQQDQEKQQDPDHQTASHAKTDDATPPQHPQQGNVHYTEQEQPSEITCDVEPALWTDVEKRMHDDLDPRMFEEIHTHM